MAAKAVIGGDAMGRRGAARKPRVTGSCFRSPCPGTGAAPSTRSDPNRREPSCGARGAHFGKHELAYSGQGMGVLVTVDEIGCAAHRLRERRELRANLVGDLAERRFQRAALRWAY